MLLDKEGGVEIPLDRFATLEKPYIILNWVRSWLLNFARITCGNITLGVTLSYQMVLDSILLYWVIWNCRNIATFQVTSDSFSSDLHG